MFAAFPDNARARLGADFAGKLELAAVITPQAVPGSLEMIEREVLTLVAELARWWLLVHVCSSPPIMPVTPRYDFLMSPQRVQTAVSHLMVSSWK
jgi:hypothetical protein